MAYFDVTKEAIFRRTQIFAERKISLHWRPTVKIMFQQKLV